MRDVPPGNALAHGIEPKASTLFISNVSALKVHISSNNIGLKSKHNFMKSSSRRLPLSQHADTRLPVQAHEAVIIRPVTTVHP